MAEHCAQPGCTGTIEDGWCNVCGSPAGSAPAPSASALGKVSGPSTTSRLASTPLGSNRTAPGSNRTRRINRSSTRSSAPRLGAGITVIPSAPVSDPASAVMAVAEVPEDKRFCSNCGAPVGRSRDGKPGRTEGFCPKCRNSFSFAPKLVAGDLVGGQYQIVGALAHGGLGWIYLARDRNVSDRYVVLKGLLNAGDADAYAAAIAEQQFLAEVQHPLIVEIHNFVRHEGAGYIVMEYVGGPSLKAILKQRMRANGGNYDPIPVDQAIAYIIEVCGAFSYLHAHGLIYCDFKPDNVIQEGDAVKLIDLGGVRRADDATSAIYGTVGFQAPEVPEIGPSVPGDIYTIGRTLAVLCMEFRGYQSTFVDRLPAVEDTPLFQRYDSFHRLLAKACATDPDDRFQSADELREQLLGVLREVVAVDGRTPSAHQAAPSTLFDTPTVTDDALHWNLLPGLKVDPADAMAAWLDGVSVADPSARLTALQHAPEHTTEVRLATARALIDVGQQDMALRTVHELLASDPWEWRAVWLSGLAALASKRHVDAMASFNAVYGQVPGELAPKLALALACEAAGDGATAARLYAVCATTDAAYTAPAAFGLARLRAGNNVTDALAALDLVPPTSAGYVAARRQRAQLLATSRQGLPALADAMASIEHVTIDPHDRQLLLVDVLTSALEAVTRTGGDASILISGIPCDERPLREGLERAFRHLAAGVEDRSQRIAYVDAANRVRPRTLV
ncbi:MAG: serine/threonine protein kinase [Actinomycetia bacterium]|nr:serine/threonine protein kinase [Actinomycetes bacterium]